MVYRFEETEPIPTYLFAFAAGRFRVEEAERDGRTMRLFHRETDAAKVARNLDAIFDLHAVALAWLESYTGIPYPFGKFDFVAVPSFQYGGMEHPGAILYRASSLFLDESATQGQKLGRAGVIAHETAHMWFREDREPELSRDRSRAPVPAFSLSRRLRGRSDRGGESHPTAPREPERGGNALRGRHLPEGPDRHASAGAAGGRGDVSRRTSRVPGRPPVRERDLAGSHRGAGPADGAGSRCLEPRLGGRAGPAHRDDRDRRPSPRRGGVGGNPDHVRAGRPAGAGTSLGATARALARRR